MYIHFIYIKILNSKINSPKGKIKECNHEILLNFMSKPYREMLASITKECFVLIDVWIKNLFQLNTHSILFLVCQASIKKP